METNGSSLTASEVRALEDKHRDLLILCLKLEELAADFDTGEIPRGIQKVAKHIEPLVAAAHTLEEQKFYPDLELHAGSCFGSLLLDQVKSEHRVDRRAARELSPHFGRCRSQTMQTELGKRWPIWFAVFRKLSGAISLRSRCCCSSF